MVYTWYRYRVAQLYDSTSLLIVLPVLPGLLYYFISIFAIKYLVRVTGGVDCTW